MSRVNKGLFVGILLSAITLVAFGSTFFIYNKKNKEVAQEKNLTVVTSFYPMYIATANVVESMDNITLENLSEPETGCLHDYQLTPADMRLLSEADVFVVNGGGIEEFLVDVAKAYPELAIIDASEGLELIEDNSHVWMDVALHQKQVKNIADGLAKVDAANARIYESNAKAYEDKLQELADQIHSMSHLIRGQQVVLFQEAYAYTAKALGLQVGYVLDLDEERQVSAGEVAEVMAAIGNKEVSVVFADSVYGKEMGEMVMAETSAKTVYVETLVRGEYDKDSYLVHMKENLDAIEKAFQ